MRTVNPYIRELMTKVDTAWWRMDSNDNLMVINGLLFFDEPMPRETFKELLEQRLVAKHSRFRQRPCSQHVICASGSLGFSAANFSSHQSNTSLAK